MAKAAQSKKPKKSTEKKTALVKSDNATEVLDPKVQKEKLDQLQKYEQKIHEKTDAFLDVIAYLAIIQKEKLYQLKVDKDNKPLHKTFESYIDVEFGFKRAYYSRLNAAYAAYQQLKEALPQEELEQLPQYPEFYTALSKIQKEKRVDAITEVVQKKTKNRLKGSDILRWGTKNKVLVKEKTNIMPSGNKKKVQIFAGLVEALAGVESIAEDIKTIKEYDETKKKTLINNLKKILEKLK